jgi:hypothetical protein
MIITGKLNLAISFNCLMSKMGTGHYLEPKIEYHSSIHMRSRVLTESGHRVY